MKKLLSLTLALALCLCLASFACAEDAVEIPLVDDGAWIPFADYNFQICLPSDWLVYEVSEEQSATGVIYSCSSPEQTRFLTVAYSEMEQATDVQTVANILATTYTDVQLVTINGIDFVTYGVPDSDAAGIATLGGSGVGLYQFVFNPASDEGYGQLALQIAASISTIE